MCRASAKLAEAAARYRHGSAAQGAPRFPPARDAAGGAEGGSSLVAVDCGAAPGGWTRWLRVTACCDEVYAIDPGDLDDTVAALPGVRHLRTTAARAIPQLRALLAERGREEARGVALWASDMCVHDAPDQVNTFLRAHGAGLLSPGAAFVLTVKCTVGHGRGRFDALADEEVGRLEAAGAHHVRVMHLFSNRGRERTIVGFIR